ncbi:MAG: LPS export ABC transporter periplasmic protein LptC [Pseudomonadota bacterium]
MPRAEDRERAYRKARRHSALVRLLRGAFPVAGVAALGLYLLGAEFSVDVGGGQASIERIELTSDALRMVTPRLEGVTDDGGRYVVQAKAGTQDVGALDVINLEAVDARVTRPGDGWTHLVADRGRYETKSSRMELAGAIRIVTENGMDAQLERADIDVKANRITSDRPVRITMTNGTLEGNSVEIDTAARRVRFGGGVRVQLNTPPRGERVLVPQPRRAPIDDTPTVDPLAVSVEGAGQ